MVHSAVILATLLIAVPALAADKGAAEQHRAHQHGAANLLVTVDGRVLQVAFDGPTDNLLGFEHAPKSAAQKKAVARAGQQLTQPAQLFGIPPAAECQAQPAQVEMKLPAAESKETHSEVEAEWRWECGKPEAVTHIDASGLFKAFSRLKQLKVQLVTAQGQQAAILKPGAARLKVAP
jgi:hypothetical protein